MKEEWRDIKDFEGLYQVSNLGRVRSLDRICGKTPRGTDRHWAGRIMKPTDNGYGYLVINLKRNGKRYSRYIHRLVAEAFIKKPMECNVVNHIDYDKKNNTVSNLEWCTQKGNVNHSISRMRVVHNIPTNTGEKYISFRKKYNRYIVSIKKVKVYRGFKTLEEAVVFRNEVLNEISISK